MTATSALFVLLCTWLAIGVVCSVLMARRGHEAWSWGTLGALLGPLVVPAAIAARRHHGDSAEVLAVEHRGVAGTGPISVLIGIDGSEHAVDAAAVAEQLFGDRLGRVVLASVVDYEVAEHARDAARLAATRHDLAAAAKAFASIDADRVVLTGRPADALLAYAQAHDIDLLVVGARGQGLSVAVLGSVATRLVGQHDLPVLVAGSDRALTGMR